MYAAQDPGQARGHVGCGLLVIWLLSGLFCSCGWNVPVIAKCFLSVPPKSVVRNKYSGFWLQLELLSSLVCFWF